MSSRFRLDATYLIDSRYFHRERGEAIMMDQAGAGRGGNDRHRSVTSTSFVGLFPASDSDEDQDFHVGMAATPSPKKGGVAQHGWSLNLDREEAPVQPAAASATYGRRNRNRAASRATGLAAGSNSASEKVAGSNGKQNSRYGNMKSKSKHTVATEGGKIVPSPLHAHFGDDKYDLEAALGTQPPSVTSSSVEERASNEFEVNLAEMQGRFYGDFFYFGVFYSAGPILRHHC